MAMGHVEKALIGIPAVAGLKIPMPVDRRSQCDGAGTQEVEYMPAYPVSRFDGRLQLTGRLLFIERANRRHTLR
jgi:hypothetical protein